MAKHYEDLKGASGPLARYRPTRRRVRDLLGTEADAVIVAGAKNGAILDLAPGGVSVLVAAHEGWVLGAEEELSLLVHGKEIARARARVVRTEPYRRGVRVAMALVAGRLDLLEISRRAAESRLRLTLADGPATVRSLLPPEFLNATGEAVHFIQFHRRTLDALEHAVTGGSPPDTAQRVSDLAHDALDASRPRFREITEALAEASAHFFDDPPVLRAAKSYTEAMVTPLLMAAPMPERSYRKPLGYPGDYRIMQYYYEDALRGPTLFARVFHKLFVEHPLSAGVRTRCRYVVDLITSRLGDGSFDRARGSFRATSLGCGPAREVVLAPASQGPPIIWTLIDQEERALAVAHEEGSAAICARGGEEVIRCLNLSFRQLLADPSLLPTDQPQDFIFSTGLFDYLREERARKLIAALYHHLAPGGTLAVANALGPNRHSWCPEFVLDWTLSYRSSNDMRRIASGLPREAQWHVTIEPGGAYYFLLVRRPRARPGGHAFTDSRSPS